jgi:hypothetical protein
MVNPESNRSATRKIMLLPSVSMCVLIFACKDVATIWSTEVPSPDGQWLATARTDQYGGPGTAGLLTTVYLKRTERPPPPIQILMFSQNTASIDLKMNWLTPSQLEVTYRGEATLDFQAVKCAGVDISMQNLSNAPSASRRDR